MRDIPESFIGLGGPHSGCRYRLTGAPKPPPCGARALFHSREGINVRSWEYGAEMKEKMVGRRASASLHHYQKFSCELQGTHFTLSGSQCMQLTTQYIVKNMLTMQSNALEILMIVHNGTIQTLLL